jgi:hypothetical protein
MKEWLAIFALTVMTLMVVEVGCRVIPRLTGANRQQMESVGRDPRALQPAYANAAYDVDVLLKEDRELERSMYRPYTVWSRKPFAGQAINIDEEGIRKTHHGSTVPDAMRLWMFGGSTMWGTGAPDGQTIPSYMAKLLNQDRGLEVNVLNLGEIGFVSTQENVALSAQGAHCLVWDGAPDEQAAREVGGRTPTATEPSGTRRTTTRKPGGAARPPPTSGSGTTGSPLPWARPTQSATGWRIWSRKPGSTMLTIFSPAPRIREQLTATCD